MQIPDDYIHYNIYQKANFELYFQNKNRIVEQYPQLFHFSVKFYLKFEIIFFNNLFITFFTISVSRKIKASLWTLIRFSISERPIPNFRRAAIAAVLFFFHTCCLDKTIP